MPSPHLPKAAADQLAEVVAPHPHEQKQHLQHHRHHHQHQLLHQTPYVSTRPRKCTTSGVHFQVLASANISCMVSATVAAAAHSTAARSSTRSSTQDDDYTLAYHIQNPPSISNSNLLALTGRSGDICDGMLPSTASELSSSAALSTLSCWGSSLPLSITGALGFTVTPLLGTTYGSSGSGAVTAALAAPADHHHHHNQHQGQLPQLARHCSTCCPTYGNALQSASPAEAGGHAADCGGSATAAAGLVTCSSGPLGGLVSEGCSTLLGYSGRVTSGACGAVPTCGRLARKRTPGSRGVLKARAESKAIDIVLPMENGTATDLEDRAETEEECRARGLPTGGVEGSLSEGEACLAGAAAAAAAAVVVLGLEASPTLNAPVLEPSCSLRRRRASQQPVAEVAMAAMAARQPAAAQGDVQDMAASRCSSDEAPVATDRTAVASVAAESASVPSRSRCRDLASAVSTDRGYRQTPWGRDRDAAVAAAPVAANSCRRKWQLDGGGDAAISSAQHGRRARARTTLCFTTLPTCVDSPDAVARPTTLDSDGDGADSGFGWLSVEAEGQATAAAAAAAGVKRRMQMLSTGLSWSSLAERSLSIRFAPPWSSDSLQAGQAPLHPASGCGNGGGGDCNGRKAWEDDNNRGSSTDVAADAVAASTAAAGASATGGMLMAAAAAAAAAALPQMRKTPTDGFPHHPSPMLAGRAARCRQRACATGYQQLQQGDRSFGYYTSCAGGRGGGGDDGGGRNCKGMAPDHRAAGRSAVRSRERRELVASTGSWTDARWRLRLRGGGAAAGGVGGVFGRRAGMIGGGGASPDTCVNGPGRPHRRLHAATAGEIAMYDNSRGFVGVGSAGVGTSGRLAGHDEDTDEDSILVRRELEVDGVSEVDYDSICGGYEGDGEAAAGTDAGCQRGRHGNRTDGARCRQVSTWSMAAAVAAAATAAAVSPSAGAGSSRNPPIQPLQPPQQHMQAYMAAGAAVSITRLQQYGGYDPGYNYGGDYAADIMWTTTADYASCMGRGLTTDGTNNPPAMRLHQSSSRLWMTTGGPLLDLPYGLDAALAVAAFEASAIPRGPSRRQQPPVTQPVRAAGGDGGGMPAAAAEKEARRGRLRRGWGRLLGAVTGCFAGPASSGTEGHE